MTRGFIVLIALSFIFSTAYLYADEDVSLYRQAVKAAKAKNFDAAFMDLKVFLETSPGSKFAEGASFSMGEYYFKISAYADALLAFNNFLVKYPGSKAKVFALIYLAKIARAQNNPELAENLEKAVIAEKQIALLFRNSKEFRFQSPFLKKYRAVYFIDRIEFYIDGVSFAQIHY